MDRNSTVLQICSYYLGTKLYQTLFASIEKLGVDQYVYVFTDKSNTVGDECAPNVVISKCYSKIDRLFFHLKHAKVLNDIRKRFEISTFDNIHAHSLFSNGYIAYKLNLEYNIPYVVAVRNTDVNLFFRKLRHLRGLGVNILRNAQSIIFISESYRKSTIADYIPEKYRKEIEAKSCVIPNGIDDFWLKNIRAERPAPKGKNIDIIYAGSIDSNKNFKTTAKACELLIRQGYNVNYKIIGKVADVKYYDFIKERSFIQYMPSCQKEELINHFNSSDIYVMPSKYETFGLTYAEAMSQGLPVIYTRGQGFDGQFEQGEVGYSVQYNSPDEIAEKIKRILSEYDSISKRCVNRVTKYNWDIIGQEYLRLYKKKS